MLNHFNKNLTKTSFGVGLVAAIAHAAFTIHEPFAAAWSISLFLLAPLVAFPLLLDGLERHEPTSIFRFARRAQLPFAFLLLAAVSIPRGAMASILGLPWIALCGLLAFSGLKRTLREFRWDPPRRLVDAGLIYLAIAAFWLAVYLTGLQPPLFEPVIVFLTVVHFHYAGLLLPIFTGWAIAQAEERNRSQDVVAVGVILGIPMVATGVTLTKLQTVLWFEPIAAVWMAVSGLAAAWTIWKIAGANIWMQLASQSFLFTMPLAIAYGLRPYLPDSFAVLDIPTMRAFHGTANAIGFGIFGAIGFWRLHLAELAKSQAEEVDATTK